MIFAVQNARAISLGSTKLRFLEPTASPTLTLAARREKTNKNGELLLVKKPLRFLFSLKSNCMLKKINYNLRSPRGGATAARQTADLVVLISIHAPRGGSDLIGHLFAVIDHGISIHAPRGGSD